jgi:ABC-type branched-subunit amino acid transport system substrate-binding protein
MVGLRTGRFVVLAMSAACSTEFAPQPCQIDTDCDDALVCEQRDQQSVCVRAEDATLVIGQSAPVSGTNQALGTAMKSGVQLAFDEKNAEGGIRGRKLQLQFRDDAYQPELAESAARSLLDVQSGSDVPKCPSTSTPLVSGATPVSLTSLARGPNAVLAILGNVGTPTMLRSAPVALETGTVFFGAFTGAATLLRDSSAGPCARYLFNVRASYAQEAQATVEYFKKRGVTSYRNIISFDQADSFGQSGYDGLVAAYKSSIGPLPTTGDPLNPIFRVRYERNDDSSVPAQVAAAEAYLTDLLAADASGNAISVGIMMTDTYGAGADFIHTVSFVGANALADRLKDAGKVPLAVDSYFTDNVVISQVVPNYQSDTSDVITTYNRLITQTGATPSYTSLEGYIAARVFIAGLEAHKGPFTSASLVDTFEKLPDLGLGIGATSGFSANNHQYSNSVWGTILQPDGTFKNLYFWSVGIPIQFFE